MIRGDRDSDMRRQRDGETEIERCGDRDRETRRQRDMETEIERCGARDRETRRQTQNPLVGFSIESIQMSS